MNRIGGWIENLAMGAWLLLIPTQLGRHFWPEWSMVLGVRVDYLSPTLYLIDLVWGVWIISKIFKYKIPPNLPLRKGRNWQWLMLVGLVVINVAVAKYRWVAIYRWLRVGQIWLTAKLVKSEKFKILGYLKWIIPVWIGIEVFLGLGEVVKGGSLNGWWYWLGERKINLLTVGAAKLSWEGREILRAYGTFSHPNSLGGFLVIVLVIWKSLRRNNIGWWIVWWLGMVGVLISGGRTVWLAMLVILILGAKNRKWILGLIVVTIGWIGLGLGGWDAEGWSKRLMLGMAAIKMSGANLLFGVGLGNFVARLPEYWQRGNIFWLQPVHNVPLLLVSEIGIVGILIFNFQFSIFNKLFNEIIIKNNRLLMTVLVVVGMTGMVDHYWVTLPQNMWLLAVVLGLVW